MQVKAQYYVDIRADKSWKVEWSHLDRGWCVTVAASSAKSTLWPHRIRYRGKVIAQWRNGKKVK